VRRSSYGRSSSLLGWGIAAAIAVVVLIGVYVYFKDIREQTVTFTVTGTTASGGGTTGHKYLIFTNKGTFEDTDNLFHAKFSSSDLFGAIRVGHTYTCKVTGFRIPLFSSYKDLITCTDLAAGSNTPLP
jgi:hypothetical protein